LATRSLKKILSINMNKSLNIKQIDIECCIISIKMRNKTNNKINVTDKLDSVTYGAVYCKTIKSDNNRLSIGSESSEYAH